MCVYWGGVVESQDVSGTPFPPPDKQSIANYLHKAEHSSSTDTIKVYVATVQVQQGGAWRSGGFDIVPSQAKRAKVY